MPIRTVMNKHGKKIKVPVDTADPRPVEVPTELKRPESTDERIRRIIAEQISPRAVEQGMESLEDSEDFDIDEDDFAGELPITDAEFHEMRAEYPEHFQTGSPVESGTGDGEVGQSSPDPKNQKEETNESDPNASSGSDSKPSDDR